MLILEFTKLMLMFKFNKDAHIQIQKTYAHVQVYKIHAHIQVNKTSADVHV